MKPLVGPNFGSYRPEEVRWLLTDLSRFSLEGETVERERRIQSGAAHYAESLPVEYQPDDEYRALFQDVLRESAVRLATAVGCVTDLVITERGTELVLVSLARAGTPIGVLMRRWAKTQRDLNMPHYAVSIVRDRGIDTVALDYLAARYDPASIVFVDGWTGKGAIACELTAALDKYCTDTGVRLNDDLAVLADPGHCAHTYGTREDFLIASACLNSTVSGLVSRTVLNNEILAPGQFHGAKFYRHLIADDESNYFLDAVSGEFCGVRSEVDRRVQELLTMDRTPTWAGMATVRRLGATYGVRNANFVKPGIGETTRVLLRRVPWRVVVREADAPEHRHIRMLAAARGVPLVVDPELAYSCVGLIRDVTS